LSTLEFEVVGPVGGAPLETPAAHEVAAESIVPTRTFSDSVKERLAALRAGPPAKTAPPAAEEKPAEKPADPPPEPAAAAPVEGAVVEEPADPDLPAEAVVETAPAEAAKPADPPPEVAAKLTELEGMTARQREVIARLEAEVAAAKKAPPAAPPRKGAVDYTRSPLDAVRAFVASELDMDPDSDEAKKEMEALYLDLTSAVANVTPDPAHRAERISALTRREWDRQKKREAGETPKAEAVVEPPPVDKAAVAEQVRSKFAPIADKHPHLTALAKQLHDKPVEDVLWDVIETAIKRGEFSASESDDVLVAKAAEKAETYYKGRWAELQKAIPSTATPGAPTQGTPAAAPVTKTERQGQGRNISNADASAAPNRTPPSQPKDEKPPTFANDAERRRWATRHLRSE
jgi:hypothetical protein